MTNQEREEINKQIALPEYLMAPDGRKFLVGAWQPSVQGKAVIIGVSLTPAGQETKQ